MGNGTGVVFKKADSRFNLTPFCAPFSHRWERGAFFIAREETA